ncbi:hybrid sensor histidine kinase/response regulator [Actomonas aquatica]|uniref:histidine kinase n=1 Tax=Actomonas aquatica TaxID=2866162 RepID=A0ABZ1C7C3_9BACT|nr:ATP-binding protein [Opitutus sp. WL0086]WRQ87232.1 PAS domain-containing protein [Opitutus sp. WL0086]
MSSPFHPLASFGDLGVTTPGLALLSADAMPALLLGGVAVAGLAGCALMWTRARRSRQHEQRLQTDLDAQSAAAATLTRRVAELEQLNTDLERRLGEGARAQHESESQFRMLVDGLRDYCLIMLDPEGRVMSWNDVAARAKRFSAQEVVGKSLDCFYPPADAANGCPAIDLREAVRTGRLETRSPRRRGDGTIYPAHVVLNPLHDEQGQLQGFVMVIRDLSQEQEAKQALDHQQGLLETILENLAEGVVACDAEGRLTFFNKVAREWHGQDIAPTEPTEWGSTYDLYESDGSTRLPADRVPLLRALRGERVRAAEMTIVVPGRAPRFLLAAGDPLLDADGNKLGAVVVLHDITERKQAEATSLRAQRMESIGMLAGGIAHDLNNALAPVLMAIELLKSRYPESSSIIEAMEVSSNRGADMVKQLLSFAKGASAKHVTVKLRHLANEIHKLVGNTFPKNIAVTFDYPPDLAPVHGDPTQLHQVLLNLCVNARDAMPDGGELVLKMRNVSLTAETVPVGARLDPGDYVRVEVRDTGTGISPDILPYVFEPFFSTKETGKGTGLGLATAMSIVRDHNGELLLDSTVGEGTTFTLFVPTLESLATDETRSPFAEPLMKGDGRLVLLVDDQASIREVGRNVISGLGFRVIAAANGNEALKILQDQGNAIDLIITDRDMPEMGGATLISHARDLAQRAQFIIASGYMNKEEVEELRELGVAAVLQKPFAQRDLVRVLRHVLSGRQEMEFSRTPWG